MASVSGVAGGASEATYAARGGRSAGSADQASAMGRGTGSVREGGRGAGEFAAQLAQLGRKPLPTGQVSASGKLPQAQLENTFAGRPPEIEVGHASRATTRPRLGAPDDNPDRDGEFSRPPMELARTDAFDALDPMARNLRSQLPALASAPSSPSDASQDAVARAARVSLDQVLNRLVRRIAWSGDAHTGSAHIEFGAGALEGATLTLHSAAGELRVELNLPPGVDATAWKERIGRRLSARGLQVSSLEVS